MALYLNSLEFPLAKDNLYQVWLKLVCWFWKRRFFFLYIHMWIWFSLLWPLPTPRDHDFNKLESTLYQKAFMYIWALLALWFWRRRYLNDPTPFLHFCDYLPFEEDLALNLNNLEFPWPKDNLYQVWLKLAFWLWRKRFLKIFSVFSLFPYYLPLEWGVALHMNKSESPLPKDDLCQLWLQLVQRFWRKSWKCKSLTDARWTTDERWSE
jgi:hypothetical protein